MFPRLKSVLFPPSPYSTFLISSRFRIVVAGNIGIFVVSSYRIQVFLRKRSVMRLQDQVHAIWYILYSKYTKISLIFVHRLCVTMLRDGSRLLQTGEEKLLGLAQECEFENNVLFVTV